MDVQNGFNAKGSFGIPEQLKKQMAAANAVAAEQRPDAQPEDKVASPQTEPVAAAAEEKSEDQKDIETLKKYWEGRLAIQITEKDVRDSIFKGRLLKDGVDAVTGFMKVTFQSLTVEEYNQIDQKLAEFRASSRHTEEGAANEMALRVLSFGWVRAAEVEDGQAKTYRALGNTPEERYGNILKMSAGTIQEVIEAWKGFEILVRLATRERRLLKKY